MVEIPTTQRKYYDTEKKISSLSAYSGAMQGAVQGLQEIHQKEEQIKMDTFSTEARIKIDSMTNEWEKENQENPNNPEAIKSLKADIQGVLSDYRNNVDPVSRMAWDLQSNKISGAFDYKLQNWQQTQALQNAQYNIKKNMEMNLSLASSHGVDNNLTSALTDFNLSYSQLMGYAEGAMGTMEAKKMLDDYESNYMTSFVSGLIETSPDEAISLLDDKSVLQSFNDPMMPKKLKLMAEKQKKYNYNESLKVSVTDFYANPTKEKLESLALYDDKMTPTKYKKLEEIYKSSPNYNAVSTYEDIDELSSSILDFASSEFDVDESFDKASDIILKANRSNEGGKLSESDLNIKKQELNNILRDNTIKENYKQIRQNGETFSQQVKRMLFSFSPLPESIKDMNLAKQTAMQTINEAFNLVEAGQVDRAKEVYKEGNEKLILLRNPLFQEKKIGDRIDIDGVVYEYLGISNDDVIVKVAK